MFDTMSNILDILFLGMFVVVYLLLVVLVCSALNDDKLAKAKQANQDLYYDALKAVGQALEERLT